MTHVQVLAESGMVKSSRMYLVNSHKQAPLKVDGCGGSILYINELLCNTLNTLVRCLFMWLFIAERAPWHMGI